jgi:hypothetical protein
VHKANEYFYDANGNMIKDDNKGIAQIRYYALNLPVNVVFACPAFDGPVRLRRNNNNFIEWIYTVTGAKLRKVEDPASGGLVRQLTDRLHVRSIGIYQRLLESR